LEVVFSMLSLPRLYTEDQQQSLKRRLHFWTLTCLGENKKPWSWVPTGSKTKNYCASGDQQQINRLTKSTQGGVAMHISPSCETVKYGHAFHGTRNQERLSRWESAAIYQTA
jgi:hypothetical protein